MSARFRSVERRVLRVHVEDRAREGGHARERVHPLPEEMRRIEVDADGVAGGGAQAQHRGGVVDDEARVRLDRDADAVRAGERGRLGPVREHALLPLPVERLRELGRPRARDPARVERALRLAGAPRERDHRLDPELGGEPDGVAEVAVGRAAISARGGRVAVARERRELEPALGDGRGEPRAPRRPRGARRDGSGGSRRRGDLDGFAARRDGGVERVLERQVGEEREEEADLHAPRIPDADRPALLGRARDREDRAEAVDVVGDGRLGRDPRRARGGARRARRAGRRPGAPAGRRARPAAVRANARSPQGVVDAARPGRAAARADELPVAVPRGLRERLGPRALVGDRCPVGEREQRADVGSCLKGESGARQPRASTSATSRPGDHPQHVDVVDRHVEEVRVRHPPASRAR